MKPPQQHSKPTDAEAKVKLGGDKMHCLKPRKHTQKSPGNVGAKCRKGDGQSFINLTSLSAQPPNYSGKMKLQFFPINEAIQKVLQQEKHNPYLELTLAPRKKMSSIVQHLNTKWGRSSCAKGDLMLFPYSARPDSIASSEKWTLNDSCTAADVYVAVGSPSTFRLRYGWFKPNLEQQINEASLAPVHSAEKTMGNKPSDPSEFPSKFASPSVECSKEQTLVDSQRKVTPLSWIDCISNVSFGALLSQALPSQESKQPPLQYSSIFQQQIPATCDSFDAAIASLIAHQQTGNQPPKVSKSPPPWDADETCHAFPSRNHSNLARISSCGPGNSASSILGAIPESDTDGDRLCSTEGRKEEPSPPQVPPGLGNNDNVKPDVSSMVPFRFKAS